MIIQKYFSPKTLNKMYDFITDVDHSDNNKKADSISNYVRQLGFIECGSGTNRIVFRKNRIVIKVALDYMGIDDNNSEFKLSKELFPYVTECYENNGIISVQEYVNPIKKYDEFESIYPRVKKILNKLSFKYILDDVGPKSFMNWGIRLNNENECVILDYAYLKPKLGIDMVCVDHPKTQLIYDKYYTKLICPICFREYTISEIKNNISEESLMFKNIYTKGNGLNFSNGGSVWGDA